MNYGNIYAMEFYSDIKKNEIILSVIKLVHLKIIILSKIRLRKIPHVFSHTHAHIYIHIPTCIYAYIWHEYESEIIWENDGNSRKGIEGGWDRVG